MILNRSTRRYREALYPDYQKWSTFLHDRLFDAGTWEMENGVFKLWTDSKSGEEFMFTQAQISDGLLYLQEEDGSVHIWRKE